MDSALCFLNFELLCYFSSVDYYPLKKNYSTTIRLPIVGVATESIIAKPYQFIIDWADFHIAGLWVKIGLSKKKIILWQDIQEISNGWYIQDENAFSDPEDLIRLENILEKFFPIKRALCKTLDNVLIGKVSDFTFDAQTGQITQFMIKNHALRPIAHELLLPITLIKKVEDKTLYIEDLEKPVVEEQSQAAILPATTYV